MASHPRAHRLRGVKRECHPMCASSRVLAAPVFRSLVPAAITRRALRLLSRQLSGGGSGSWILFSEFVLEMLSPTQLAANLCVVPFVGRYSPAFSARLTRSG